MESLTELSYRLNSDKGANGYCVTYEPFFLPLRQRNSLEILEFGLATGGPEVGGSVDRAPENVPSVALWLEYFPNARITGFDICDFSAFSDDRFTFVRGDSGNFEDLKKVTNNGTRYDIIIDDASHASFHQQLMLGHFFEFLEPGGLYIIEDLNWVPKEYESTLPRVGFTRELLVDFLKTGKITRSDAIDEKAARLLEQGIGSIFLFDNGFMNALRWNFQRRYGLALSRPVRGSGWRAKSGFGRFLDPYFWRFLTRSVSYAFRGEEYCARDYIQLAILQKKP